MKRYVVYTSCKTIAIVCNTKKEAKREKKELRRILRPRIYIQEIEKKA